MVKKFSMLAIAGLIAVPTMASAGGDPYMEVTDALEKKIADLSQQLADMKASMAAQKSANDAVTAKAIKDALAAQNSANDAATAKAIKNALAAQPKATGGDNAALKEALADLAETVGEMEENSDDWDLASRFQLSGDFRARMDSNTADTAAYLQQGFNPTTGAMDHSATALVPTPASYDNDTMFTNRLRINMRVKATENVEFKGRLAMYKAWGMQSNPIAGSVNADDFGTFDGASTRHPDDSVLRVDRAFVNWNNIGGNPVWFSIGRRPTTDGPPAQLRLGSDSRMATPVNFMDYPFDGISLGYAYSDLAGMGGTGRVRFCYGRGFESGVSVDSNGLNDVDFAGISWDVLKKGDMFLNVQSFGAFNMFNFADGMTSYENMYTANGAERANLGDIYHTSAVFMNKVNNLNYFVSLGWSRVQPSGYDGLGYTLMAHMGADPMNPAPLEEKDGESIYIGARYDIPDSPVQIGAEFNYGTKNWLSFTPGHDDLYQAKLATRGKVYELYAIYDLPTGAAISKYASTKLRFGIQHYDYKYTGSGSWLGAPVEISNTAAMQQSPLLKAPVEQMDNIYVSLDVSF